MKNYHKVCDHCETTIKAGEPYYILCVDCKSLILQQAIIEFKSSLKEKIEGMPRRFPNRECDEYDHGYSQALNDILEILN